MPIAVLTNGSLLRRADVRGDLSGADWVSVMVDAAEEETWRTVNRPHPQLKRSEVLKGAFLFAREFAGTLVTETMLVAGLNDAREQLEPVADFLGRLEPRRAYLSIPTRPPAEPWVRPPDGAAIVRAREILRRTVREVEVLSGFEGVDFDTIGPVGEGILAIAAVHPVREDALSEILGRTGADRSLVQSLLRTGALEEAYFEGKRFYRRKGATERPENPVVSAAAGR